MIESFLIYKEYSLYVFFIFFDINLFWSIVLIIELIKKLNIMKNESKSKVSVNIYSPLAELLNIKLAKSCIKRDAYLDLVIKKECEFLCQEIKTPNTNKVKKHISKKIKGLNTKPVSLFLSAETAQLLNKVCDEKNVARDAFLNRIYLLLTISIDAINTLFPEFNQSKDFEDDLWQFFIESAGYSETGQDEYYCFRPNIIDTVCEFTNNSPFWLLRSCISKFNSEEGVENIQDLYSHAFEADSMKNWPESYPFTIKDSEIVCFNTSMDEIQLIKAADDFNLEKMDQFIDKNNKEARSALDLKKLIKNTPLI